MQGWLFVTRRRAADLFQLCKTSHPACLVTLHSYTPGARDSSGSGLPHPANPFSFEWKERHETPEHKAFPTTGITRTSNLRNHTKILLQVPRAWSCSLLLAVQPVIRSVSCACCPSPAEAAHLKLRSLQQEFCFETSTAMESDKD